MNRRSKQLLEEILADFDCRISKLRTMNDFLVAEELERFKNEYFIERSEAVTKWTQRASSESSLLASAHSS